jgi:hypothetical protein
MSFSATWPTDFEVDVVDSIRDAIGRDTTWYVVASSIACPTCIADGDLYDPVTQTSTDSFCPTCSGSYYIPVYSGTVINGHITWAYSEQLSWPTGSKQFEGDVRIQIKYTEANINTVNIAKWVEVDGRQMEIKKKSLRGVKNINRILVDLLEKDKL